MTHHLMRDGTTPLPSSGRPKAKKKGHDVSRALFLEGAGKTDISDLQQRFKRTTRPAFWPAALLRRKFGAATGGGELRRGGFADPEHLNSEG